MVEYNESTDCEKKEELGLLNGGKQYDEDRLAPGIMKLGLRRRHFQHLHLVS
jgi:hypothetical protein